MLLLSLISERRSDLDSDLFSRAGLAASTDLSFLLFSSRFAFTGLSSFREAFCCSLFSRFDELLFTEPLLFESEFLLYLSVFELRVGAAFSSLFERLFISAFEFIRLFSFLSPLSVLTLALFRPLLSLVLLLIALLSLLSLSSMLLLLRDPLFERLSISYLFFTFVLRLLNSRSGYLTP